MRKDLKAVLVIAIIVACCIACFGDRMGSTVNRFSNSFWETTTNGIVSTSDTDVMYMLKTVVKTISIDDDSSTDDFQFDDDAANTTEQPVRLGTILPAYAEIVSAQIRCIETVSDGSPAVMALDLGTSSGGNEILATADTDSITNINSTGAGDGPEVVASNSAKNVWINATPDVNWNTLTAGRWTIMVTYLDYGAVNTQKNP